MTFPNFRQLNIMDCGPTCLRIVAQFYQKEVDVSYLRDVTATSREGTNLAALAKGAERIGFRTLPIKVTFNKLRADAPLPLIAHWNQMHYVVVYKISQTSVYVSDPANGLLKYSHAEFIKHWIRRSATDNTEDGVALLLETTSAFDTGKIVSTEPKLNIKKFLLHYIKPHSRAFLQIFLSLLVGSFLQLLFPFLTQSIVDIGIVNQDIGFVWLILICQLFLTFGQMIIELTRGWTFLHVSNRISISLISDFFAKLMRLPIRYFDTRLTGDLFQRIQDQHRIEGFLTNTSFNAIFSLFNLVLYSVVLLYYSVMLFVIFLLGSVAYISWILLFLSKRKKLDYKTFQQAGDTNSKIYEIINGMQEIKLHNAEQQKRWNWERVQVKLYKIGFSSLQLEQTQSIGSRIINEIKNIFITIVTATLVISGELTLGMMVSVSYIIGQLNGPVIQLVGVIKAWQDAKISLERLAEIHEKKDESQAYQNCDVPTNKNLLLKNVSFRYNDFSEFVLNDVSIQFPANKVTAIVGASGSGKTTMLKLLMRFYSPIEGEILVDKTQLNLIDLTKWREECGVVMQEGFIFNDTIANNIAVGDGNPDIERITHALEIANITEFVNSLPLKINTKIGQEGLGISTGQKQRILIARAIYKQPSIVFFDEATSSLDANNEAEITKNMRQFYSGRTVIIVAHRLSTVIDADKILVLDKGKIVEEGTHETLTSQRGYYFNLVKNQLELGK